MGDFDDRVVLVTGAAGHLGREVARAFAARGASLVLTARSTGAIAAAVPEISGRPDVLVLEGVDVTDPAAVEAMVSTALDARGRLDVLVHTVGGYRAGRPVHEMLLDDWEGMLALNARSAFVVARAVVPSMLAAERGSIVLVGAAAALQGGAGSSAYAASKAAVARLTESLAAETKRRGVRVNAVLPGTIDTPPNRAAMPDADHARWVAPDAIADVIAFLASDQARAVTGALIPVYGRR